MPEDIHVLARRANQALTSQPGFVSCEVQSVVDRVLAYTFTDDVSAHQFQQQRELLGMRAIIDNAMPSIVLVTHL